MEAVFIILQISKDTGICRSDLRYSEPVSPGALKKTSPVMASGTTAPVLSQDASNVIVTEMRSPRLGEPPSTANMEYLYVHLTVLLLNTTSVPF